MSTEHTAHIEEPRLLQVVIENARMTEAEDEHLAQCRQCRSAVEDLKADLESLRRASEYFTPERTRRVTLPESAAPSPLGGLPRGWRVAAGAVATLCLATFIWWQAGSWPPGPATPEKVRRPLAVAPDPVMLETRMLAENAMPVDYQAIMESLDGGFDQGFIDFVIPPLNAESLS